MSKLQVALVPIAFLSLVFLATCAARRSSDQGTCVFVTGALNGVVAPCGCAPDQLGGLPRRGTMLAGVKGCPQRLLLDNGNLTMGFGRIAALKSATIAQSLDSMGYFAVNLGEQDWFLGLDTLNGLAKAVPKIHWLCANLRHGDDTLPVRRYAVWRDKAGGPSVLVIGVLSRVFEPQLSALDEAFVVEEPAAAIQRILVDPAAKADVTVLMLHGPVAEARALGEEFPAVDLLVAGLDDTAPDIVRTESADQLLLTPGLDGEHVVSAGLTADPKTGEWSAGPREVTPLSKAFADSPAVLAILKEYQKRLFDERLLDKIVRTELEGGLAYVGSRACQPCHRAEFEIWSGFAHARAYETLVHDGHEYDPDCVSCHVTGFGRKSGFYDTRETPDLAAVGCEACHGPGNLHSQERLKMQETYAPYGSMAPADCMACHTDARSPGFDYDTHLPKIKHWSDEQVEK